ncbi:MAG: folate family ECF transporter S component [Bacteroidales bacterium]|nr:folate family ECF transporter S component [Bacteroidales bacterium]
MKFAESSKELTKPVNLSVTAMLLAVSIVLKYFENNGMAFIGTNLIKIGFSVFPIAVIAMLYGPVAAGIAGGLNDVMGYIIAPVGGAYIPGFTISMILVGVIYGLAFYKEEIKLPRIIVAEVIITLFINIILGVTWFIVFYGMPMDKALSIRGIKEFFDLPISVALNFVIFKAVVKIPEVRGILKRSN